jgi:EmrB/QacA subfamily drug resistance transporter
MRGPAAALPTPVNRDPLDQTRRGRFDPETVHRRRWWTLVALCLSLVLVIVGNTVLNVALPTLVRELDATNSELQWMVDAYALVFAGLLLTSGALGDRFGRKHALTAGLIVFGAGAVGAALSDSPAQIIAARGVMGVGASFVMPATLSILAAVFPPEERPKAIAIWAGLSGAGAAIGPVAGGWLLEHFWWGSVFLLNVPIVVIALVSGRVLVPNSRDPHETPLDPVGAGLSIVGVGALVYGIIEAPVEGWTSARPVAGFAVAAVGLVAFCLWERRTEHPMLDLAFFRRPAFSAGAGAITLVFFAMFGSFFLLTQFFQLVLGYTPLEAGVRLLPVAFTLMLVAPNSARVAARIGTRNTMAIGLTVVAAGLALFTLAGTDASYASVLFPVMVLAFGMGMTIPPATSAIMSSLPLAKAGVGSAVNDTTRELGGALGVAILGSIVASAYSSKLGDVLPAELPAQAVEAAKSSLGAALEVARQAGVPELAGTARTAFVESMHLANVAAAVVSVAAAAVVLKFMPSNVEVHPHGGQTAMDDETEARGMATVAEAESFVP